MPGILEAKHAAAEKPAKSAKARPAGPHPPSHHSNQKNPAAFISERGIMTPVAQMLQ
jgi:hypothetical protein